MRPKERIKPFLIYIEREWMKDPDLRFGQLLFNLGIGPGDMKTYQMEMKDYPLPHELVREIETWGKYKESTITRFGIKDNYINIPIKDLDIKHIKNILKTQSHIKGKKIEKILKEELKFRKKNKIKGGRNNMANWGAWLAFVGGILSVIGQWSGYYLALIGGVVAVVGAFVAFNNK